MLLVTVDAALSIFLRWPFTEAVVIDPVTRAAMVSIRVWRAEPTGRWLWTLLGGPNEECSNEQQQQPALHGASSVKPRTCPLF